MCCGDASVRVSVAESGTGMVLFFKDMNKRKTRALLLRSRKTHKTHRNESTHMQWWPAYRNQNEYFLKRYLI